MSIGWKDAVGTVIIAGIAVISYARLHGFDWPLLGSYRAASVVILTLGVGACIAGSWNGTPLKDNWTALASILGILAFGIGLINVIANSRILFVALAVDIVVLWAITILHHLVTKGI